MADPSTALDAAGSRYQGLGRVPALLIVAGTLLVMAWALQIALVPGATIDSPPAGPTGLGGRDVDLYRAIVQRVRAGEGYYEAAQEELRAGGYPTRSVFNWRFPLLTWLIAAFPGPDGALLLLAGLMLAAVALVYGGVHSRHGRGRALADASLLTLALAPLASDSGLYFAEPWAGTLIVLSLAASACGRWRVAVAAGVLALFLRELALPFALISLALAGWQRRRGEAKAWLAGLALYGACLGCHGLAVAGRITDADHAHPGSWLQLNGLPFILETAQRHPLLDLAPLWVTALSLPLLLLALAGWRGELGLRVGLTALVYVTAFGVVGFRFNAYWGHLYVPLLTFGLIRLPGALRDLARAILRPAAAREPLPVVAAGLA